MAKKTKKEKFDAALMEENIALRQKVEDLNSELSNLAAFKIKYSDIISNIHDLIAEDFCDRYYY